MELVAGAVTVRRARPEEYGAAGRVVLAAYEALGMEDDEYASKLLDAASRDAVAEVLVAVDEDGRVLGSVTYVANGGPLAQVAGTEDAEFRMLGVDPRAQRRGVGEALVRACIDRARAAGLRRLVLSTAHSMHAAHRLYERLAFRRAPELDWSPDPDFTLLCYVKDLTLE